MSVFSPAVVGVSSHEVAGSVIVQSSVPSVTRTGVVDVPAPGAIAETAASIASGAPMPDGLGVVPVMATEVLAGRTLLSTSTAGRDVR